MYVTNVDKEKYPSYEEYKKQVIKPVNYEYVDVEERKEQAEDILKSFMKGG